MAHELQLVGTWECAGRGRRIQYRKGRAATARQAADWLLLSFSPFPVLIPTAPLCSLYTQSIVERNPVEGQS